VLLEIFAHNDSEPWSRDMVGTPPKTSSIGALRASRWATGTSSSSSFHPSTRRKLSDSQPT
jgi:hypothetical protein